MFKYINLNFFIGRAFEVPEWYTCPSYNEAYQTQESRRMVSIWEMLSDKKLTPEEAEQLNTYLEEDEKCTSENDKLKEWIVAETKDEFKEDIETMLKSWEISFSPDDMEAYQSYAKLSAKLWCNPRLPTLEEIVMVFNDNELYWFSKFTLGDFKADNLAFSWINLSWWELNVIYSLSSIGAMWWRNHSGYKLDLGAGYNWVSWEYIDADIEIKPSEVTQDLDISDQTTSEVEGHNMDKIYEYIRWGVHKDKTLKWHFEKALDLAVSLKLSNDKIEDIISYMYIKAKGKKDREAMFYLYKKTDTYKYLLDAFDIAIEKWNLNFVANNIDKLSSSEKRDYIVFIVDNAIDRESLDTWEYIKLFEDPKDRMTYLIKSIDKGVPYAAISSFLSSLSKDELISILEYFDFDPDLDYDEQIEKAQKKWNETFITFLQNFSRLYSKAN